MEILRLKRQKVSMTRFFLFICLMVTTAGVFPRELYNLGSPDEVLSGEYWRWGGVKQECAINGDRRVLIMEWYTRRNEKHLLEWVRKTSVALSSTSRAGFREVEVVHEKFPEKGDPLRTTFIRERALWHVFTQKLNASGDPVGVLSPKEQREYQMATLESQRENGYYQEDVRACTKSILAEWLKSQERWSPASR